MHLTTKTPCSCCRRPGVRVFAADGFKKVNPKKPNSPAVKLPKWAKDYQEQTKKAGKPDVQDVIVIGKSSVPAQKELNISDKDLEGIDGEALFRDLFEEKDDEDEFEDDEFEEGVAGLAAEVDETPEQAAWRKFYTTNERHPYFFGPLKIVQTQDKGRGMVTTRAVKAGDLLLVSDPLDIKFSEEGTTPENEELAEHMLSAHVKLTPTQLRLLDELWDGDSSREGASVLWGKEELEGQDQGTPANITIPYKRLERIVNLNCLGEEFQDPCVTTLRQGEPLGHVGLWPEPSLLNHSCTPNAIYYVIEDQLFVRASEDIPGKGEVTISYLGAAMKAPLGVRRGELQEKWGFKCNCKRCVTEEAFTGTEIEQVLTRTYDACQELAEKVDDILDDQTGPVLAPAAREQMLEIKVQVEKMRDEFETTLRISKVTNVRTKRWLQAAVYDMYDLLSVCADEAEAKVDTECMAVTARIIDAVLKGSDANLYLSAEYFARALDKFGDKHQETLGAREMVASAYRTRYGNISDSMVDLLVRVRLEL